MLEKYASVGCIIAFMDTNKELGRLIKEELERLYNVAVSFSKAMWKAKRTGIFFSQRYRRCTAGWTISYGQGTDKETAGAGQCTERFTGTGSDRKLFQTRVY